MFEFIVAWIMLFVGWATQNPLYFIASGAFAVAGHLSRREDI